MNPLKHYKCCVVSLIDNWGYTLIHHLTKGGHEKKMEKSIPLHFFIQNGLDDRYNIKLFLSPVLALCLCVLWFSREFNPNIF